MTTMTVDRTGGFAMVNVAHAHYPLKTGKEIA